MYRETRNLIRVRKWNFFNYKMTFDAGHLNYRNFVLRFRFFAHLLWKQMHRSFYVEGWNKNNFLRNLLGSWYLYKMVTQNMVRMHEGSVLIKRMLLLYKMGHYFLDRRYHVSGWNTLVIYLCFIKKGSCCVRIYTRMAKSWFLE